MSWDWCTWGFALDEGESIGGLLGQVFSPTPAIADLRIDDQGFAWLPQDDFVRHFAADVDPIEANVMYAVQQPLPLASYDDVMGLQRGKNDVPPTGMPVVQNDEAIPPDAECLFAKRMGATASELRSGHVGMVSASRRGCRPDSDSGSVGVIAPTTSGKGRTDGNRTLIMKIVVIGGTGLIGSKLVTKLA